jgi:hypothetical protein
MAQGTEGLSLKMKISLELEGAVLVAGSQLGPTVSGQITAKAAKKPHGPTTFSRAPLALWLSVPALQRTSHDLDEAPYHEPAEDNQQREHAQTGGCTAVQDSDNQIAASASHCQGCHDGRSCQCEAPHDVPPE